jgi:hypothetical protein
METGKITEVGNTVYASIWKTSELNSKILQGYPLRQYLIKC